MSSLFISLPWLSVYLSAYLSIYIYILISVYLSFYLILKYIYICFKYYINEYIQYEKHVGKNSENTLF